MNEDVRKRLESLGYTTQETDGWLLNFLWEKTEQEILSETNLKRVPDGLYAEIVDAVCGTFLLEKKQTGGMSGEETARIVSKISAGDMDISFQAGADPDQSFLAAVSRLSVIDKARIGHYRKLVF